GHASKSSGGIGYRKPREIEDSGVSGSRERALFRHAGAPRETLRRRPDLAKHEEALGCLFRLAGDPPRDCCHTLRVCRRAHPEHHRATFADERQAPLGGRRRLGECLRHGHACPVHGLFLGPSPNDTGIRRRPALEKFTLPPFGPVPSLDVSTPSTSLSRSWTTFRSTAVIGSSRTGSPAAAWSAARSAIPSSVARLRSR